MPPRSDRSASSSRDVTVPMRRGLRSAGGAITERRSIVVASTAGDVTGWGEAAPVAGHSLDTADDAWVLLIAEAELIVAGEELTTIEGSTATAAMDASLADLAARSEGSPLAVHLGGAMEPVPASVAIDLPRSGQALLTDIGEAVAAGYRHVKLKIDPTTVDHVAAVRDAHPRLGIGVDANGSFDRASVPRLVELDRLGLDYVEQPFAAGEVDATADLRATIGAAVCLDESIRTIADITAAAGLADAVTLKPGRLGPTLTRHAMAVAVRNGLAIRIGGMVETGIGRGLLVALAGHPAVGLPSDLAASSRYFDDELVAPPWSLLGGHLVPRAAVVVDRGNLTRFATRHLAVT